MRVPDWPLGLSDELAERYRDAAECLIENAKFRHDEDRFNLALNIAIIECERARAHAWNVEEDDDMRRFVRQWEGARSAARKVANALGKGGIWAAWATLHAVEESGVRMGRAKSPPNVALAALLRDLAKVQFKTGGPRSPAVRFSAGPLLLRLPGRKSVPPSPAAVVTIFLAHLFRRAAEHSVGTEMVTWSGEELTRFSVWNGAAAFASATGVAGGADKGNALAESAKKWCKRNPGPHLYLGWPGGEKDKPTRK